MQDLTKEKIDSHIEQYKKDVKDFSISKKATSKFSASEIDQEWLSYIDGENIGHYLKFIPYTMKKFGVRNAMELGNREGLSTVCTWDGLAHDGRFISVDIEKDLRYCPEDMFHDKRVDFVYGDVSNPDIYHGKYPKDVEFLFMDTIHFEYQSIDEFEVNQHFLADKALVAIDDINMNDKRKFFDKLPYTKWDLTELCHKSGWGLFLYERKQPLTYEQRIFEAYKAGLKIFVRKNEENTKILEHIEKKRIITRTKDTLKKIKPLYKTLLYIKNKI